MKALSEFTKATLIGGLVVILPLGVLMLAAEKIVEIIRPLAHSIAEWLPRWFHFPDIVTLMLLLLLCFVAGLLAETRAGQSAGNFFERIILNHIPGYSIVRTFMRRIGNIEESEKFTPALAELENALVPAFVVEKHIDGRYTVFVPTAPTPGVGTIYILAGERVHLLDVSLLKAIKCITSWGAGSDELLKAMRSAERSLPGKPDQTEVR
jgi:uncharacterized membrane protein